MPSRKDGNQTLRGPIETTGWQTIGSPMIGPQANCIRIALINNMPDAALEDTESQFFRLLAAAAGRIPLSLQFFSLPDVPRSERGRQHLQEFYLGLEDLWNSRFDGIIMTGTEPRHTDLRREPYWDVLVDVLDWAERNTVSTVLSCLAAHAAVLWSDGIERRVLVDKQFGVFEHENLCRHVLTSRMPDVIRVPHSRWNGLRESDLAASGYQVLTKSPEAGVDLFVKSKRGSLFLHFQGHPEYEAQTLLKEYRRDVKRFLKGERDTYPTMPQGYFDRSAAKLLLEFQEKAIAQRAEELMAAFPDCMVGEALQKTWHNSSVAVYRNWLHYLADQKPATSTLRVARVGHG